MIRIGIVGIGFMGMIHYYAAQRVKGARVVAICTRDEKKRNGDWTGIQGNFGPRGGVVDLEKVRRYAALEDLLADRGVDLVDICLPARLHAAASIAALTAGKHVLCEKPIALNLRDAAAMLAAERQSGRQLLVAHVLPFFPEFAYAREAVVAGKLGRILAAHFHRVIAQPQWSADLASIEQSGGMGVDLHIHDNHFIQLLFGPPTAVFARGELVHDKYLNAVSTQYLYQDQPFPVTCLSGGLGQPGRTFAHGFAIYGEQGALLYDFGPFANGLDGGTPLTWLARDGKAQRITFKAGDPVDAFTNELQAAVNAAAGKAAAPALAGQAAADALQLCYREAESVRRGRPVALAHRA